MSRRKKEFDPRKTWSHKGKQPKSTAAERLEFCRELWTEDPHIPINGNKGMNQRLLEKFGTAARAEQLMIIRSEVLSAKKAEKAFNPVIKQSQRESVGNVPPLPKPPPIPPPPVFPEPLLKAKEYPIPTPPEPNEVKDPRKPPDEEVPVGASNSTVDVNMRYDYARSYYVRNPRATNEDVNQAIRDKFGVGISAGSLTIIKKEEGVGRVHHRAKPRVAERRARTAYRPPQQPKRSEPPMPQPQQHDVPAPRELAKMHTKETAKGPLKAAIQMLLEEIPNLKSLDLQLDEDGKATVADFEVYSRAYETGSIEL